MAVMTVMPRAGDWTVDDLDALPSDGLRYELVDGVLLVTPAPVPRHQRAVGRLFLLLNDAMTDDTEVFVAPLDYRPTRRRSLEPDVMVVRVQDVGEKNIAAPPLQVVEVLSPGTRSVDLLLKRGVYEESKVPAYWLVDPDEPSMTVLELDGGGRYEQVGRAVGDELITVSHPYLMTLTPSQLVSR